jgi:uncharacterized membrane protein YhaH (DUF805 family)
MKKYFYSDGEEKFGPFTLDELKEKNISRETLVWSKELEDWQKADRVSELKEIFFLSPPPLKKTYTKNKESIYTEKTTNWYLKCLKQYADFSGRARRKEYWMFALFNMIFFIVAMILDNVLGLTVGELPYGAFYFLYALAVLIPGLAVSVRRLHDVGKSGWMILISLIPIVGGIWLLVLMLTDSNLEENQFGANPKTVSGNEIVSVESSGDTVILLVVIWMFFSRLFWTLIPELSNSYYSEEWFKPINGLMTLIWGIIPIGLAFTVKDNFKKIVLFILGGIYLAYQLYEVVKVFIS